MKSSLLSRQASRLGCLCAAVASLLVTQAPTPALADWPNTNATKFVQLPDLTTNGMDIWFANYPTILADDFVCTNTGPISDIHLWISSIENVPTTAAVFELSVWSDVPGDPAAGIPSHPGLRLWSETFNPGTYAVMVAADNLQEEFWNLDGISQRMGTDTRLFLYNFYPKQPFTQQGSTASPTNYWLGVSMQNDQPPQGWKTSTNKFADDAVLGHYAAGAPVVDDWKELRDPRSANGPSLQFAFALTTTNPPPVVPCPETNVVKFIQHPNIDGGLDVLASQGVVLADDFNCTNTGPVTDIHIWGSWLQNAVEANVPIWLGIYDDVPAVPGQAPSHPGALKWQQWFGPGEYSENPAGTGNEQFYDPTQPAVIGPDTQAYYLCFFPTNPFVQQGTATAPAIYWLSVYAQTTPTAGRSFGWKTALPGEKFGDDAVWARWPGAPPTVGWNELIDPAGNSLNLAFKLTTLTNPCPPVSILCPKDKQVECGVTWAFDPPTYDPNTCCGTNVSVQVVSTTTNGQCPEVITRRWQVVDCSGNTNFCVQAVTVVDTTRPTLVCAGPKTVPCDVPWSFDPPTASDLCCSNVTVAVVSTVTNGVCPEVVTVTRTWMATDCCTNQAFCSQIVTLECCPPPATNKWVQYPDLSTNGLDVKATSPKILADDFLCVSAGPITNIQIWGSWLNDAQDNAHVKFVLGLWTDVPVSPTAGGYSHPGRLLWSETFGPNEFETNLFAIADEHFYDPNVVGPTGIIGPDTQVWWYSFLPRKPYCQQGSTNQPVTYWLSVHAVTLSGTSVPFGWKTSADRFKDDAVYGHVNAAGTPLGDWKDLHDPRPDRNNVSLNLAFLLNSGPPTPDCEPVLKPKYLQRPDTSVDGLDVRATAPKMLADDFPCRIPGFINGITVWGSWLNDQVDPNATFQLGLWSDVRGTPDAISHPGQLLCTATFLPPQTVGTSVLRYRFTNEIVNLQETFYDPDLSGTSGFIGHDSMIWRYDFYPFVPSCWRQLGRPFRPFTYWLSVTVSTDTNKFMFGWKTSTNHWMDDAVYGHVGPNNTPLQDWKDLHDPRTTRSLDLAFALRRFPFVNWNKDFRNITTQNADCIEVVLAGIHEITWHYDDYHPPGPWPNFQVSYAGGNTILRWCGKTVPPGGVTHIGFSMTGVAVNVVSMSWLSAGTAIGKPIQVNLSLPNNGQVVAVSNNIIHAPVLLRGGTVEVYAEDPPPLDQMTLDGTRMPLMTFPLPQPPVVIPDGGLQLVQIPAAGLPPEAQYLLVMLNLDPPVGLAGGGRGPKDASDATTDFILLPLDAALAPLIDSIDDTGGNVTVTWTSVPGRTYQLQYRSTVTGGDWSDGGAPIEATDTETSLTLPESGVQTFYRVELLPMPPP